VTAGVATTAVVAKGSSRRQHCKIVAGVSRLISAVDALEWGFNLVIGLKPLVVAITFSHDGRRCHVLYHPIGNASAVVNRSNVMRTIAQVLLRRQAIFSRFQASK